MRKEKEEILTNEERKRIVFFGLDGVRKLIKKVNSVLQSMHSLSSNSGLSLVLPSGLVFRWTGSPLFGEVLLRY